MNQLLPQPIALALLVTSISVACTGDSTRPPADGNLEVVSSTTGQEVDTDGYTVTVDGGSSQAVEINDSTTFVDLAAGDHGVELLDVAGNCSVGGENPRTVTVPEDDTAFTTFEVNCNTSSGGASGSITGLTWACDSRITESTGESDLWPVTWSDDGHQYTAWGDGNGFEGSTKASFGIAQIQGEPTSYTATDRHEDSVGDGNGKLAGIISVNGVLYFWKNMQDGTGERRLFKSTDKGETDPVDTGVVFPHDGVGPETFIQMGQDHGAAPGSYVYAEIADFNSTGGEPIYLMRAPTSGLETQSNWEVFSGTPSSPAWSTDFTQRTAIHQESGSTSKSYKTTITYIPPVEQYVLTWPMDGDNYASWKMLVADDPYGPYTEIASYSDWCGDSGESTGQLHKHIAPKWIGDLVDGALDFWLVWSGLGDAPADEFNIRKGTLTVQ